MTKTEGLQKHPSLWNANFSLVFLISLFHGMAFQGLNVSLPIYIDKQGGSSSFSGIALASLTLAAVMIRPFTGWALDTYGRKFIFVSGLVLFLLPSAVYVFIIPIWLLLILRFAQGLGWGISHTTIGTIASDVVPTTRIGEGMGTFGVTSSISFALGPLLSMWLIDRFSFRGLFIVISLLTGVSIIFSQVIKYPLFQPLSQKRKLELFAKGALRPALVVLLAATVQSSVVSFLPLFIKVKGIGNPGLFFTFMGLTTFITRPLCGRLLDRMGQKGFDLAAALAFPMIGIPIWTVPQMEFSWQLALGGVVFGFGYGTIQSSMLALFIKRLPGQYGSANAMYGTFLDTGIAVGSILWGVIANGLGYRTMFQSAVIPIILASLIFFLKVPARQK